MTTVTKRVLVAEDDRVLRRACEEILKRGGYTVLSAEDGAAALELARQEHPDLVLLDLLMPKLSGLDVLRSLKAADETRDIPVVILSNSSRAIEMDEATALGAAGYLVKANLSLQDLIEHVRRHVGD